MAAADDRSSDDEFPCPHCGAELSASAKSCRECGSDLETGWSETAEDDSLELPESMSDAEHDEFLLREFPTDAPARLLRRRLLFALFGITLAVLLILWTTRGLRGPLGH